MNIKALVSKIKRRHGSGDPFKIADELGMVVIFAPLVEVRGMRQNVHRRTVIYVNSELDEKQQSLVCAHELGHHFLHRKLNRLFMDRNTTMVTGKYENEAYQFALELLYSDEELQSFLERAVTDAAQYMGVSIRLAEQRMATVALIP